MTTGLVGAKNLLRPPFGNLPLLLASGTSNIGAVPILLPKSLDVLETHEIPKGYDKEKLQKFIEETKLSEGAELANAQTIFRHLCEALSLPPPTLKKAGGKNDYVFEEDVADGKRTLRIDVYRRGRFIFEAKQGVNSKAGPKGRAAKVLKQPKQRAGHSKNPKGAGVRESTDWVDSMRAGRHQAGNYAAKVASRGDPKPPFLLVADVGYCLWIWSSFSADAKDDYGDFEPLERFSWDDLQKPEVMLLLQQIWLDPQELNEEVRGQKITADIAALISDLATRLENRKLDPEEVGDFLMKCVFTMFAEDVQFLPLGLFTDLLKGWRENARRGKPQMFVNGLRALWLKMRDGGDLDTGHPIRRFNGYLFRNPDPLALDADEIDALYNAARADWRRVSPAIFGTLLERALSKSERHKLGAHYTPEAYIRRLIDKALMAPLREEWTTTRAEMELRLRRGNGDKKTTTEAIEIGHAFRRKLSSVRVLDPACGSGNFLYVALKELKRLEGEVIRTLYAAGDRQEWFDMPGNTVHPEQFYGIEIKPWAAKIAELVLWIGYLQWQVSAGRLDRMPPPLLQDLQHIKTSDALITAKKTRPLLDSKGRRVMWARGVTDKKAERTMVAVEELVDVTQTPWPEVDVIVGNPPFVGNKRMKDLLDPGYVEALREAYPGVPKTSDLVVYWWWRCAELVRQRTEASSKAPTPSAPPAKGTKKANDNKAAKSRAMAPLPLRFGLVTTDSITQKFNRAVAEGAINNGHVRIAFAIPTHPWYDEGAAVRIAMTAGAAEAPDPVRGVVVDERKTKAADLEQVRVSETHVAEIHADLYAGANVLLAIELKANEGLAYQGMNPVGEGFRLTPDELATCGFSPSSLPPVVKPYLIGRDLVKSPEERYIIDFYGVDPVHAQTTYPVLWNRVVQLVKPERDRNNRGSRAKNWWLFGEPVGKLRAALAGLKRYIATCRTARQRAFTFLDVTVIPDTKLVAIALDEACWLAVLSSRVHVSWANRTGGWLGVGHDSTYNHVDCFEKFPFPVLDEKKKAELESLGNRLDTLRKGRQKAHPTLSLTDMYSVLEKIRSGQTLNADEKKERADGLIDTLRQLHDDIDKAVLEAYGWPVDITEDDLLYRLVDLNAMRAQEEAKGIRWLRPSFQVPTGLSAVTAAPVPVPPIAPSTPPPAPSSKSPSLPPSALAWPSDMPSRIRALTEFLRSAAEPVPTVDIAKAFKGAKVDDVDLTLQCAAAADAIVMSLTDSGETSWGPRANLKPQGGS